MPSKSVGRCRARAVGRAAFGGSWQDLAVEESTSDCKAGCQGAVDWPVRASGYLSGLARDFDKARFRWNVRDISFQADGFAAPPQLQPWPTWISNADANLKRLEKPRWLAGQQPSGRPCVRRIRQNSAIRNGPGTIGAAWSANGGSGRACRSWIQACYTNCSSSGRMWVLVGYHTSAVTCFAHPAVTPCPPRCPGACSSGVPVAAVMYAGACSFGGVAARSTIPKGWLQ